MKLKQYVSNILLLLVTVALISIPVSAHAENGLWNVSGFVLRSDTGAGLSGLTVSNGSNASQTTTTNSSGGYILNTSNTTVALSLSISASAGYTQNTSVTFLTNESDDSDVNVTYILITPTITAVTETTPTFSGETISWTVTATDGVNNNYVGSRVLYSKDSALTSNYFYSGWSNDTTAPSLSLTNLEVYTKYYYQVETYNHLNGAYSATTTGDFTTKSGVTSTYGKPSATAPKTGGIGGVPFITDAAGKPNMLVVLAILGVLAYFVLFGTGGSKKGGFKKGRKK